MDFSVIKQFFEEIGAFLSPLSSLVTILAGTGVVSILWRWIDINRKSRCLKLEKINRIISPIKGSRDIIADLIESKYYIPIMVSTNDISLEENGTDIDDDSSKKNIVDVLVAEWKSTSQVKTRYLVFGGSGTGKTTFVAALIYKYIYCCGVNKEPYAIVLLHFDSDVLDKIKSIPSPERSILVLDALDENREAIRDIRGFIERLSEVTKDFHSVVVTSRKQLFESDNEIPQDLPILGLTGELSWTSYFILPFSMKDVQTYLGNKYHDQSDYCKALQIVERTSNLMSRAMILSFIDDLLDIKLDNITKSQIYKVIIDKWLDRELKNISDRSQRSQFIKSYYVFSKYLAKKMYDNWLDNKELAIPKEQYNSMIKDHSDLFPENGYPFNIRSVVENTNGDIVFAHKSFWEFFIAIYAIEDPGKSFVLIKSDNAQSFANELSLLSVKGIKFEEILYYKPMTEEKNIVPSEVLSIIDRNEELYNQCDNSKKEEIYFSTLCQLYRYICLRFDYDTYSRNENTSALHTDCHNFLYTVLLHDIFNDISSNAKSFSEIRGYFNRISELSRRPVYGFQYSRKQIVIYGSPSGFSESGIHQNNYSYQIWFADCFSCVSSFGKTISSFLNTISTIRDEHFISTIGIIKEMDILVMSDFVIGLQNELKRNNASVNVLLSVRNQNVVVPLLIRPNREIEKDNLSDFLHKMFRVLPGNCS